MKNKFSKIENKVAFIVGASTFITAVCVAAIVYSLSYNAMIEDIQIRSRNIAQVTMQILDNKIFYELNTKEDMSTDLYANSHEALKKYKDPAGVMYLYTAKMDKNGNLIYLVDALTPEENVGGNIVPNSQFKKLGDTIDPATGERIKETLTSGKVTLPTNITVTDRGQVFITYWPVYDSGRFMPDDNNGYTHLELGMPIGAIGIEIDASIFHNGFRKVYKSTFIFAVLVSIIFIMIALRLIYTVSTPYLESLAYTDFITKSGNRTSFELKMEAKNKENLKDSKAITTIAVIDLNELKKVNDVFGHKRGDKYIMNTCKFLENLFYTKGDVYRIGGDEFAVIIDDFGEESVNAMFKEKLDAVNLEELSEDYVNFSYGVATFDKNIDENLETTFSRADKKMYIMKDEYRKSDHRGIIFKNNL